MSAPSTSRTSGPAGDAPRPTRRSPARVAGLVLLAVAGALLAAAAIWPVWFGLSTVPGVLHALSFRSFIAVGGVAAGLLALLVLRPWRRTATGARRWWQTIVVTSLLAVGVGNAAVVAGRGWATGPVAGEPDLVVVGFNTQIGAERDATSVDELVALVTDTGADVVSLPETPREVADQVAARLAEQDRGFQVFSTRESRRPTSETSLLVAEDVGPYEQTDAPDTVLGTVRARPVGHDGPVLVAVHAGSPVRATGWDRWAASVATAVAQAAPTVDGTGTVVVGDFNATVDHAPMRDLPDGVVDAASAAGRGAEGTWPSSRPVLLASPIDHVLVDGNTFLVLGTHTVRVSDSDHRAVVADLALRAP
ncbi:endonuclease/exonuclease/phosphatase family protein [Nakamurella leprariae]|uniref:Endonuclease/exonuclease/phosphatase family protein n=1 Tax=Nakamurella leprariae TaxID=2803911 RepID=A0A938Y8V9_9ACTN|nr:endonuclease/exonuclease/phosphatase family protein [Nakamurella leprariae]MBM9468181.1 endonuclease/exonuclease/phosphatase family protein [Nakamurella leprariae]